MVLSMIRNLIFGSYIHKLKELELAVERKNTEVAKLDFMLSDAQIMLEVTKRENLNLALKDEGITGLDKYLQNNGWVTHNVFAYKDKRLNIPLTIQEMITTNSYVVLNEKRKLELSEKNTYANAKVIGDYMVQNVLWTNDNSLHNGADYYIFPSEILTNKKGDCEDYCFCVSSFDKEIGIAYGYYKTTPHAFSVFAQDNKLYVLETNFGTTDKYFSKCQIVEYDEQSDYDIHWIFTPMNTYKFKASPQHFGHIAGWL